MIREAAVAGRFYPGTREGLLDDIRKVIVETERRPAVAVVCPHAGYQFSGTVSGAVYSRVVVPETVVILGVSHRPGSDDFATMATGAWRTPLGDAPIDSELAKKLLRSCQLIKDNARAHRYEHSIEVQVPFLQAFNPKVQIVPIAFGSAGEKAVITVGEALGAVIKKLGRDVLIVASTDMSHTTDSDAERQEQVRALDMMAIDAIRTLDAKGLMRVVHQEMITMCGYAPTAAACAAAKKLGATGGDLVEYRTSYDVTGDSSYVVGYAGMIIR
ncbi:MAG: AmmeMemoRadiSam system protein B [Verrucomicrobia bacterium]|nr:AmmeMemoRadiSam system protein B [Verrucomicrobiota bacterium]